MDGGLNSVTAEGGETARLLTARARWPPDRRAADVRGDEPDGAAGGVRALDVARGEVADLGLYPIVTLEKQLPNMIGNLV